MTRSELGLDSWGVFWVQAEELAPAWSLGRCWQLEKEGGHAGGI